MRRIVAIRGVRIFDQRCGGQRFRHRSLAECSTDRHRVRLDVTSMPLRQHCEGTKPLWKAAGTGHLAELAAKNGQMLMMCMKHGDVLTRSRCVILRRCDAKAAKELGDCHGIPLSNGKRSRALQLFRYAYCGITVVSLCFESKGDCEKTFHCSWSEARKGRLLYHFL